MLKVEVESLSQVKRRLAIEVPHEQVAEELERAYSSLSRHAHVKGFRPGRVPRAVLERQFGDRVRGEVFGKLIQESFAEAVRERHIDVVGQPEIVTERADPGDSLRFAATVEVYPEVEAGDYAGLKLERRVAPVTDADVETYLERLRESLAQLRPVEGRTTAERGDVASLDYEGRVDGRVVAKADARICEIGRGAYPEAFEARLPGAVLNQPIEFPVTYATDDPNTELAGKTVQFTVTIHNLALKEVPPLDDEFAKDHGECATLAELRERVRRQLEARALRDADERVRAAAVTQLVARHDVELPDALVARQTEQLMVDVTENWRARRIWPKDERAALTALRDDLTPRARDQVKAALVLDAVAQREHVEVTDAEVDEEIEASARAAGDAADKIRSLGARPEARHGLQERIRRRRALDRVLALADITTLEIAASDVAGEMESR